MCEPVPIMVTRITTKVEKSNNQSVITSLTLTDFSHLRIMKRFLGFSAMFLALVCFYAFQPVVVADGWQTYAGESDSDCSIIEAVHDFHGVVPPQSQLTVRTCQLNERTIYDGFFEIVKSSAKVFFATFSSNKVNRAGFQIQFPKFDISFPFSVFW